jgi:dynactin 1
VDKINSSDVENLRQERQTSEEEARNLSSRSREMMDLNLKLQATSIKSLAKAIDFELRKEHAVEAEEQLNIIKVRNFCPILIQAYLPEAFESERSSIQGLLRFKRLSFKTKILRTFLLEQHTVTADPKLKPSSFDADHAIARTLVVEQLAQIQSITSTFAQYFSKCSSKEFEGASAIFHELDPVEKGLDRWLENLRSGEMNERACSESLHGYPGLLHD